MPERQTPFQRWLPMIIQTIAILAGAFSFSQAMEHRLTVTEQSLEMNRGIVSDVRQILQSQESRIRILEINESVISANQSRSLDANEYLLKLKDKSSK